MEKRPNQSTQKKKESVAQGLASATSKLSEPEPRYVVEEVGEPMMEDSDSHGIVQTGMDTPRNGVVRGADQIMERVPKDTDMLVRDLFGLPNDGKRLIQLENDSQVSKQFPSFSFNAIKPCLNDISNNVHANLLEGGSLRTWKKLAQAEGINSSCPSPGSQGSRWPELNESETTMPKQRCVSTVGCDDKENFQVVVSTQHHHSQ